MDVSAASQGPSPEGGPQCLRLQLLLDHKLSYSMQGGGNTHCEATELGNRKQPQALISSDILDLPHI